MKRNNKRKYNRKESKKVTRCKAINRPVFEHEFCSQFISKINSNSQKNCENCRHAF